MHEDRPITQRDPRFGGNMERANVGAQYAGASRDFYGGPSRGSPMLDQRYENYQAPHRVDYTSPPLPGTPNFRPPYGAPGQPSYNEWQQQIDPFHTGPYPPKQHPNPRMRHINPRGMNKTVDPLYNLMAQQAGAFGGSQSYGGMGRPQQEMPQSSNAMDNYYGFGRGLDVRNPVDYAIQQAHNNPSNRQPLLNQPPMEGPPQRPQRPHVNPRMRGMGGGLGGLQEQSKIDLQDIFRKYPGLDMWQLIQNLDKRGIEYANRGGLMSLRR